MRRHFYDSFIDTQNMIRRFCTISLIIFTLTLGGCAQVIAIEVATIAVKATAEILGEVMDAVASPSSEKAKVSDSTTKTSSDSDICTSATQGVESQKRWRGMSSAFYEYVVEAKNRGLTCGVGSSSSTTKISSVCSLNNLNACSDDLVCQRGSRLLEGKRYWDKRSKWIKYSIEAKKRNLSCGVKTNSSTSKTPSDATCLKKVNMCNNAFLCTLAAPDVTSGKKAWQSSSSEFYKYVVEAKSRRLSCGVKTSNSTTQISSACSFNNLKVCSNGLICARGSRLVDGKRIWDERSYWIKYSVEAKKRGLTCGVISSSSTTKLNYTNNYICERAAPPSNSGIRKWLTTSSVFYKYVVVAKKRNLTCGVVSTSSTTTTSSDSDICTSATQGVESQKRWRGMSSAFYEYVVEAKKRGLSCGVKAISSTTKTSSVCSSDNLNICLNSAVCVRGTRLSNGKRIWDERSKYIKYSVEAKKRGLSCGVKAISSTTKTSSVCSSDNLNICLNSVVCVRGTRLSNGKRIWDERSKYIKYSVEAKKRGLSCGVKAISSVTKVSSVCSIKNTKACNDNDVCQFSTITNAGKKAWYKSDHSFYQYVTEAKKRNLTCGVEVSSSTTKTSPACSTTSVNTCTDYLLCRLSTITDAGKQVWFKSDHFLYPYVIEAKKRNLSCGIKPSS
jgi:hypothetical protein